ncbi:MAG: alkaline phosphatase [Chloroflexi bacterium]|nr:alkaline phosphatase [Chloroflexota bacterium]
MINRSKLILVVVGIIAAALIIGHPYRRGRNVYERQEPIIGNPADCAGTRLAVIGDFGEAGQPEADVAALVTSWDVDAVLTLGDNNYFYGEARTIDANIGQYYHAFIAPYHGNYGPGADVNRIYPALGNHDWNTGSIQAYLDYFMLPGNERYYDVQLGPVQVFVLDSDVHEPDGRTADSIQAQWLQTHMSSSPSTWKLALLHHAPFSSGKHGNDVEMQWPFTDWGATAVLAGHDHTYERIHRDGILYFVNGLGGQRRIYTFGKPVPGSTVRYNQDYGAMLISANETCLNFSFYNRTNELIDSHTIDNPHYPGLE